MPAVVVSDAAVLMLSALPLATRSGAVVCSRWAMRIVIVSKAQGGGLIDHEQLGANGG